MPEPLTVKLLEAVKTEQDTDLIKRLSNIRPVLLVEDNPNDALLAKRLLESIGLSVVHVDTGKGAIDKLFEERKTGPLFSLILLDLKLEATTSGVEVLKYIRCSFPSLHVVVLTGMPDPNLLVEAGQLGYFGLCLKPLKRSDVLEIMIKHNLLSETKNSYL